MRTLLARCLSIGLVLALGWTLGLGGCSKADDPTEIVGDWVVDPTSMDNAAFNIVRSGSERAGKRLSDAEIDPVAKELAEKLRGSPAAYTFAKDGTFTAVAGENTADGTWTYSKDVLTLESPSKNKPMRFLMESGQLTSIGESPRHRNVRLLRK